MTFIDLKIVHKVVSPALVVELVADVFEARESFDELLVLDLLVNSCLFLHLFPGLLIVSNILWLWPLAAHQLKVVVLHDALLLLKPGCLSLELGNPGLEAMTYEKLGDANASTPLEVSSTPPLYECSLPVASSPWT